MVLEIACGDARKNATEDLSRAVLRQLLRPLDAVRRGDIDQARELGARLQPLADSIFAPPITDYRARTKEALKMLGVLENTTVRPPLLPIPESEHETIRQALQSAGLLLSPVNR